MMKIKDVVSLKEVANDLKEGKDFYDQRQSGVGDYFWDSLVADIESLIIQQQTEPLVFEKNSGPEYPA
jgi:hypothetical protein